MLVLSQVADDERHRGRDLQQSVLQALQLHVNWATGVSASVEQESGALRREIEDFWSNETFLTSGHSRRH